MKLFFKRLGCFILAIITAAVLSCIASTQFVLAELGALGVDVPLSIRVTTTLHDVLGMGRVMVIVYFLTFLIAFLIAALCTRLLSGSRQLWFAVAGMASILTAVSIAEVLMGMMPIAGARSVSGFMAQGLAGAAGGWLYAWLTTNDARGETTP